MSALNTALSDPRHTRGPWQILKFESDERYVITDADGTKGIHRNIAEVSFGYREPAETEQHANARLIAASPELWSALQELYRAGLAADWHIPSATTPRQRAAMLEAHRILAKVRQP